MKRLLLLIIFFLNISSPVFAEYFPEPPELKDQIEFWKLIYSKYTTKQGLIHDYEDLAVIYTAVDIENDSSNSRKSIVNRTKERYADILESIVYKNKTNLTDEEERVLRLFKDQSSSRLLRARNNIRFQLGQKDRFMDGVKRSGRYMNRIQEVFKSQNLPLELSYLPNVESSFNTYAYSKFGAAGLWQFIRSTGKNYLSISDAIDERLDPIVASIAAAKLLKHNYTELGTWPLAITAYNHGLQGMKRAVGQVGTTDIVTIIREYNSRIFGFASRNFYTEFIAAKHVYENHQKYFGNITLDEPLAYSTVVISDFVNMDVLIKYFKTDAKTIEEYNPEIRPTVYRGEKRLPKKFILKLPKDERLNYAALYDAIPSQFKTTHQRASSSYRVKRGDSLSTIAQLFKTSVGTIKDLNHIGRGSRIYVGQILKLPSFDVGIRTPMSNEEKLIAYNITTLSEQGIEKEEPKEIATAGLVKATLIENIPKEKPKVPEKKIITKKIPPEEEKLSSEYIRVLSEETLGHFADWLKVPTHELRRLNKIQYRENIHLGQRIKVVYQNVTKQAFEEQRNEYHTGLQEDFWNNYKVASSRTYTVRKGQSVWTLAYEIHAIPIWLLQQYNPEVDLSKLHAGENLVIPQVTQKLDVKRQTTKRNS